MTIRSKAMSEITQKLKTLQIATEAAIKRVRVITISPRAKGGTSKLLREIQTQIQLSSAELPRPDASRWKAKNEIATNQDKAQT